MNFLRSLGVLIVVAVISAAPFPALYRWIYEGDALVINNFFVVETEHVKPSEVREYLKSYLGKPLYGVDLGEIARAVERHPWVSSVTLRRAPPHEIVIEPVERAPVALVSIGSLYLIDEQGIPFRAAQHEEESMWPLVKTKQVKQQHLRLAAEAIKDYNSTRKVAGRVLQVHVDDDLSLHVTFENGLETELGNDRFKEKWQKLDAIMNSLQGDFARLAYIYLGDYPNPQQVAVKFKMENDSRGYINGSTETR